MINHAIFCAYFIAERSLFTTVNFRLIGRNVGASCMQWMTSFYN